MAAKAYGSITIVDIGDLGTLSVTPESNQPISVIYDPNQGTNGTYVPDWTESPLTLTPIIYYGGTQIKAKDATVTWKRKVKSGSETSLTDGENMDSTSKVLTVNKNVLTESNSIITYICNVSYVEPQTEKTLNAKGQISFSLISQPTTIKSCSIIGESVFRYNGYKQLVGSESIKLTANLTNCEIVGWQYKNGNTWTPIKDQTGNDITEDKLTINAIDDYFTDDIAIIRLMTNVTGLYDYHTITKIYDGAPGESVLSIVLDNEDIYVPCNSDGSLTEGALSDASTKIYVYEGNKEVTDKATIKPTASGAAGTYNSTNHTYTVTSMTAETARISFEVTYGGTTVNKIFNLTKLRAGVDGVTPTIYSVESSHLTVNRDKDNNYSPSSITFNAYSKTGNDNKIAYAGRFKIYVDGVLTYPSSNDESQKEYTIPTDKKCSIIKAELYKSGSTTTLIDSQTVTVVSDGATGKPGTGGLSFVLGNPSDTIPCNTDRTVSANYTITIPFAAYKGIERIACEASYGSLPNGITPSSNTAGTADADGSLVFSVSKGSDLGGKTEAYDTGSIQITLTANGVTNTQNYTWTKNIQAKSGADAVVLQVYAPGGNIINNGENDVILSALMTSGTTTVTKDISYQWYVFKKNVYEPISDSNTYGGHTGYITDTLTVPATAVESYASYRVDATWNKKTYSAYISVQDKTDPIQVEIFSTLGDKITNSFGKGCVYAKVFREGTEMDALQNLTVSDEQPSNKESGDVWAHIDTSLSKIILKKWNGTVWEAYTPKYKYTYNWTFGDYNGKETNLNGKTTVSDKFLYINGTYITKKMQFNLEVIEKSE